MIYSIILYAAPIWRQVLELYKYAARHIKKYAIEDFWGKQNNIVKRNTSSYRSVPDTIVSSCKQYTIDLDIDKFRVH